ncbi:MAG: hypothetical protein Q8P20_10910 [bacterium]|nr:hypothetical protein [bacterium]
MKYHNKTTINVKTYGEIEQNVSQRILTEQRRAFQTIVRQLKVKPPRIITINLYKTRRRKIQETRESGNCHADIDNNSIHALLNNRYSLGHHEMVHILAKKLGKPPKLLSEGLALWFDKTWHGVNFLTQVKRIYRSKRHSKEIINLFADKSFNSLPGLLSYNMAGAIARHLVKNFGMPKYLRLYKRCSRKNSAQKNMLIFYRLYKIKFPELITQILK